MFPQRRREETVIWDIVAVKLGELQNWNSYNCEIFFYFFKFQRQLTSCVSSIRLPVGLTHHLVPFPATAAIEEEHHEPIPQTYSCSYNSADVRSCIRAESEQYPDATQRNDSCPPPGANVLGATHITRTYSEILHAHSGVGPEWARC